MDIVGIGIDATEIDRIADVIERYGDRFIHRVFTDGEIAYCRRRRTAAASFAARFAAKEAAMKALGTGHALGVVWRNVEVVRTAGPPRLELHGAAASRFAALGGIKSVLTLTHARDLALAHVILLGRG
jgi:holo-[acyl-carrier protein] synthase